MFWTIQTKSKWVTMFLNFPQVHGFCAMLTSSYCFWKHKKAAAYKSMIQILKKIILKKAKMLPMRLDGKSWYPDLVLIGKNWNGNRLLKCLFIKHAHAKEIYQLLTVCLKLCFGYSGGSSIIIVFEELSLPKRKSYKRLVTIIHIHIYTINE